MGKTYSKERRAKADLCIPQQIQILANYFNDSIDSFKISSFNEDVEQGLDLIYKNKTIGLRVRPIDIYLKYCREMTIKERIDQNYNVELKHLQDGFVDYFLYCFECKGNIIAYRIIDMDVLRPYLSDVSKIGIQKETDDGLTIFWAINLFELDKKVDRKLILKKKDLEW